MTKSQPAGERRHLSPEQVYKRSNMPSRWERLTGVSPKIAEDKLFLSFVAARYIGEQRLPDPGMLVKPDDVRRRQDGYLIGGWASLGAFVLTAIGLAAGQPIALGIGVLALIGAVALMVAVSAATASAILDFNTLQSQCVESHARLHSDNLDPEYRSILNGMIDCDEGTLAYCAAKVASEIQRQVASGSAGLEVIALDLWDELEAIGMSAREIAEDREETERLEQSRLRDKQQIRETIAEDKELRERAIALLAARVSAFADYRDRLQILGTAAWRDSRINSRAMRLASDELAATKSH